MPSLFLRAVVDFELPEIITTTEDADGEPFAVGTAFLPADDDARARAKAIIAGIAAEEGVEILGWRTVPTDPDGAGVGAAARRAAMLTASGLTARRAGV